ncbi:MAG TPA: hypothetical protein VD963_02715 [Phycisphaerales bacterium]|nr:hypothetical protein [Phycisphaerales bacterium]
MKKFAFASAVAVGLLAQAASAQSFNVDLDTAPGAPGAGAPATTFGAAAGQAGFWNTLTGSTATAITLSDLLGNASRVMLTRSSAAGGNFSSANANANGDFALLMEDGQDLSASTGPVSYVFSGLAPGSYDVYTYANAPDFGPDMTIIATTNPTGSANPQTIGGNYPAPDTFGVGITHALHSVTVGSDGLLTITADGDVGSFGTVNGFQLTLIPAPGSLALLGLSALAFRRRRA